MFAFDIVWSCSKYRLKTNWVRLIYSHFRSPQLRGWKFGILGFSLSCLICVNGLLPHMQHFQKWWWFSPPLHRKLRIWKWMAAFFFAHWWNYRSTNCWTCDHTVNAGQTRILKHCEYHTVVAIGYKFGLWLGLGLVGLRFQFYGPKNRCLYWLSTSPQGLDHFAWCLAHYNAVLF